MLSVLLLNEAATCSKDKNQAGREAAVWLNFTYSPVGEFQISLHIFSELIRSGETAWAWQWILEVHISLMFYGVLICAL